MLRISLLADTSQAITTTDPHLGSTPNLTTIPVISGVVSYGGTPLANMTGTLDLLYFHTRHELVLEYVNDASYIFNMPV